MLIYSDNKYKKFLIGKTKIHYKEKNPTIQCVPNGIIANEHINGYGVFDENFNFVKASIQQHKNRKGQFVPKIDKTNIPYIDCDAVYLCHTGKNNFGHFILEHLNRGWCFVDKKYQNMKVVIVDEKSCGKINDYIFVLLGLLGVDKSNIILLDKTTRFRNVYIPGPAFDISAYYTDACVDMYNKIADAVPESKHYDKIYLSRCAMPLDRHTYGEEKIQSIFEKNGYKIIYPETLPLTEQISLVRNCKFLAGCAGTALHLALFMKKGGTVIQIKRNTILLDNADTQHLINMTKGLESIFVAGSIEKAKTDHWSVVPQIIGLTKYMKQFFDDNHFVYDGDEVVDDKVWQDYEKALGGFSNKGHFAVSLKKAFIHYTSCFLIGRMTRKKYRHFMQRKLGLEQ